MDLAPFISPIVTAVIAIAGTYMAMNNRVEHLSAQLAALDQKVDDLRRDVEKHNNVVERTVVNERDIKTAFHHIDELKERDDKIEAKIERLHD